MYSIDDISWLIVRYPKGAGGKMLAALLQHSQNVAWWNESDKGFESWFTSCFTTDYLTWLDNEPKSPWGINKIVSSSYPRGDDYTDDEFLMKLDSASISFHDKVLTGKLLPMVWHKRTIPSYLRKNKLVDLYVDESSKELYLEMTVRKRYYIEDVGTSINVTFLEHRPSYKIGDYFNDYVKTYSSKSAFMSDVILPYYKSYGDMRSTSSDITVSLSELCDPTFTKTKLLEIAEKLDIKLLDDIKMLERCHHHWLKVSGI